VKLSTGVTGRAPAPLVWERYVKPALWSSWSPQISAVECRDAVLRVGTVGVVHTAPGLKIPFEVTEFDSENMVWAWNARLPLSIQLSLRHSVHAVAGGARTVLQVSGPAPVVLGYLPLARLALWLLVRPVRERR